MARKGRLCEGERGAIVQACWTRNSHEDPLLSTPFDVPFGQDQGRGHRGWLRVVTSVALVARSKPKWRGGKED